MATLTIDIFDVIGAYYGEGVSASSVAEKLTAAPDADRIKLRINSPGGSVSEGNTIHALLMAHKAPVDVEVHGMAASMGSVIAMVGRSKGGTVKIAKTAMFMVHDPSSVTFGTANDMRKTADTLDKIKGSMAELYSEASGLTVAKATELMTAETWMTAKEAVANGFADESVASFGEAPSKPAEKASARIYAVMQAFQSAPDNLSSTYATAPGRRLYAAHTEKTITMNRDQILLAMGLSHDASDESIKSAGARASAPVPSLKDMVPRATLDDVQAKFAAYKLEVGEARVADHKVKATSAVDAACKAGKIAPAQKEFYMRGALSGAEGLKDFEDFVAVSVSLTTSQIDGEDGKAARAKGDGASPKALTAADRAVMAAGGLTEDEFLAARATTETAQQIYGGASVPASEAE